MLHSVHTTPPATAPRTTRRVVIAAIGPLSGTGIGEDFSLDGRESYLPSRPMSSVARRVSHFLMDAIKKATCPFPLVPPFRPASRFGERRVARTPPSGVRGMSFCASPVAHQTPAGFALEQKSAIASGARAGRDGAYGFAPVPHAAWVASN